MSRYPLSILIKYETMVTPKIEVFFIFNISTIL